MVRVESSAGICVVGQPGQNVGVLTGDGLKYRQERESSSCIRKCGRKKSEQRTRVLNGSQPVDHLAGLAGGPSAVK